VKTYIINWEYIREGTSEVKAKNLDDATNKAGRSVTDFGDPKQFNEVVQWDTGWKIKSIEGEA